MRIVQVMLRYHGGGRPPAQALHGPVPPAHDPSDSCGCSHACHHPAGTLPHLQQLQQLPLQQQPLLPQTFPPLGLGSGFGGFSPQTLQPVFLGFQSPQQVQPNMPRLPQQLQPNPLNPQMLLAIAHVLAARQRLAGAGPQQPMGGPS